MKYAYIGDCEAGFVTCFGHKWESGVPYDIDENAIVPGSVNKRKNPDGSFKNPAAKDGIRVLDKLDGNMHFTNDLDQIAFLAAAREERLQRERIMREKNLTFTLKDKSKKQSILANPDDEQLGETVESDEPNKAGLAGTVTSNKPHELSETGQSFQTGGVDEELEAILNPHLS